MKPKKLHNELMQLRALGQLIVERSYSIEKELGFVQTPTPHKGIDMSKAVADVLAKRNAQIKK